MNYDLLNTLIKRGETFEVRVGDPQKLADWVADVESFLISENKRTSEAAEFIKNIKFLSVNSSDIYNLVAYLKQLGKTIRVPQITKQNQIFVAMWFNDEMDSIYENGYLPIIQSLNYSAMRIDKKEYNDSIMNEIYKEIPNSIALIADLTNNRGGVYHEAGIARGLKLCGHTIELIFTCRKDFFTNPATKPHFDVQGNNIIVYFDVKELKEKLGKRLQETIKKR